jgi:hypothetical protein
MIGKKKLSEIRAEVAALMRRLPGRSPRGWFRKEIKVAAHNQKRDVETLEMLCAALERETRKRRKTEPRQARSHRT